MYVYQFLVNKFENGTDQSYDLNIKVYVLYKNSAKEGDNVDERKRLKLIVTLRLTIFFLIIIRQQNLFLTQRIILT